MSLDPFPELDSPRIVRPPVVSRRRREGYTILEYVVGAAAGCIVGGSAAWLCLSFVMDQHIPFGVLYFLLPGVPLLTVVMMKLVGKAQL